MVKQPPTLPRLLVMAAFALSCFGLLLFLWTSFGGPVPLQARGYRLQASFAEGVQLAEQADVRISGVPVGRVVKLRRVGARTLATLRIDARYAPLRRDVRAMLRTKTLLGETYVELTPGSRSAPALPDGARLPVAQVAATTELDEVIRAFTPDTRRDLRTWVSGWAAAVRGRSADVSDVLGQLPAVTRNGASLLAVLDSQRRALGQLVHDAGVTFDALGRRQAATRTLITASDRVLAATSSRDVRLTETLHVLPTFLRELRPTLEVAQRTAALARPVVSALRPAAPLAQPVLRNAYALAPSLRALLREADPVLGAADSGLPAATRTIRAVVPLVRVLDPVSRDLRPVVDYLGVYRRELVQSWMNVAAAAQATYRNPGSAEALHYLRVLIPFNNETFVAQKQRLPSNRHNPYFAPGALDKLATGLESFDCRNTDNPAGSPPPEALGGQQGPPCRVQAPWTFDGATRAFAHLERDPR